VLLIAYLLLGLGLLVANGTLPGLPFALASTALLAVAITRRGPLPARLVPWLVAAAAGVVLADSPSPLLLVPITILQGLAGVAAFVRPALGGRALLAASVGLYAIAGALVITARPRRASTCSSSSSSAPGTSRPGATPTRRCTRIPTTRRTRGRSSATIAPSSANTRIRRCRCS
jgi:hypothetical protein